MENEDRKYWQHVAFKARLCAIAAFSTNWQLAEKFDAIADAIADAIENGEGEQ